MVSADDEEWRDAPSKASYLSFSCRVVFGDGISKLSCAADGGSTLEARPSSCRRRCASCHDGGSGVSCSQWATAASSHHCKSRGITRRCTPASMKARIERSSLHSVRVQNVKFASLNSETAKLPGAFLASRAERNAPIKKTGK